MRCLDGAEQKDGRIECEGEAYFTKFCMEPCDRDDLLPAARFKTDKKKYFVCNAATSTCAEFAADCGVEIICADGVYERLKARGALPEKYTGEVKKVKFFCADKVALYKKTVPALVRVGCGAAVFQLLHLLPDILYSDRKSAAFAVPCRRRIWKKERGLKRID